MKARERIAFLNGLIEGVKPEGEDQRRIYEAVIQALQALADEIDEQSEVLDEQQDFIEELSDYCEQLEADMTDLEEALPFPLGEDEDDWDDEGEEDLGEFGSITCPECGHVFFYDPEAFDDKEALQCPGCGFCIPCEGDDVTGKQ